MLTHTCKVSIHIDDTHNTLQDVSEDKYSISTTRMFVLDWSLEQIVLEKPVLVKSPNLCVYLLYTPV